jgi:hypothetical protein
VGADQPHQRRNRLGKRGPTFGLRSKQMDDQGQAGALESVDAALRRGELMERIADLAARVYA